MGRERATIVALIWAAALFYVFDLGLYSDDWGHLVQIVTNPDQTFGGLFARLSAGANLAVRPLQSLWYVAFDKLAPGNTTLVHLGNHLVFTLAALALYAALRRIEGLRRGALAITAVYVCLPNFVTAKLWYANHQSAISALFAFAALYAIARLRESGRVRTLLPGAVAVAVLACLSMLAYELLGFVILAWPLFAWLFAGPVRRAPWRDRALVAGTATALAGFGVALWLKLPHFEDTGNTLDRAHWLGQAAWLYRNAAVLDFWKLGLFLPRAVLGIALGPYFRWQAAAAAALALAILYAGGRPRAATGGAAAAPEYEAQPLVLLAAGGILFALGYVPFLTNFYIAWSPFGISDRTNAGAAVGLAVMVYALYRLLARAWPRTAWWVLAVLCAMGVFVQVSVGRLWAEAWPREQRLVHAMVAAIGPLRPGQSVLVYGICPYYGPAPVLTSSWDVGPRMEIETGVIPLSGDTINATTRLGANGLSIAEYGFPYHFAYAGTVVYDAQTGTATSLGSEAGARAFFAAHPISRATPCRYEDGAGQPLY